MSSRGRIWVILAFLLAPLPATADDVVDWAMGGDAAAPAVEPSLTRAPPPRPGDPRPGDPEPPEFPMPPATEEEAAPSSLGGALYAEPDSITGGAEESDDREAASAGLDSIVSPRPPRPFAELRAGATLATRSLRVDLSNGGSVRYGGAAWTELELSASVFPLAPLVRAPWASALGAYGSIAKGVSMDSTNDSHVGTDAVDGDLGLLGRISFGTSLPIEVRGALGWGRRRFELDENPDLATFDYRYYRAGLEARAAVYERPELQEGAVSSLTLGLGLGLRVVDRIGDAGHAYGTRSDTSGFDASAMATVLAGHAFTFTARGELVRFTTDHSGTGTLSRDAWRSQDLYVRGMVEAGFLLR